MDLGAYANIEDLEALAKANGIDIPRLRGYRLMKDEEPLSKEELDEMMDYAAVRACKDLCQAAPFWNPNSHSHISSSWADYLCNYYLVKNDEGKYCGVRWDRIHGWKRRILKFEIKKERRAIKAQYDLWNKYAGQENVLYIHSRIGGNNWKWWPIECRNKLMSQPWFLDRVDDFWDSTYCDFYARISLDVSACRNEMEAARIDIAESEV